jgi:hypothetical protein
MSILLYAKELEKYTDRVKDLIVTPFPDEKIEKHHTIKSLSLRLRQPMEDSKMVILLISSRNDLMDILTIQHLFRDTPIILFTPDNEAETIGLAHQLRPRFLSDLQGDFRVATEVLKKMVQDQKERREKCIRKF